MISFPAGATLRKMRCMVCRLRAQIFIITMFRALIIIASVLSGKTEPDTPYTLQQIFLAPIHLFELIDN